MFYSIVKQHDAFFTLPLRGRVRRTCIIAPCSSRPQGKPLVSVPSLPQNGAVRNALAKGRFRDPPGSQPSSPHAVESYGTRAVVQPHERGSLKAEPGPRKQPFACVPHTDGFIGLLRCPRDRSLALTSPRSCVLTPGHSLEPSASPCRGPPPQSSLDQAGPSEDIRGRQGLRTSVPRSTPRDQIAARSVSVRDDQQNIPTRRKVQKRIRGCANM